MPTKKTKTIKRSNRLEKHEPNIKAVLSLFILAVAAAVFYLFWQNQDALLDSTSLRFFVALVVVLSGLLIYLLYLINPHKK